LELKVTAKWVILLFLSIVTIQLALNIFILFPTRAFRSPYQPFYSPVHLATFFYVAAGGSLPTLILARCKLWSWIPYTVRRGIHFILTLLGVGLALLYSGVIFDRLDIALIPVAVFVAIYIIAMFFFEKHFLVRYNAKELAKEQETLQLYTDELELYQLDIRKFRHDYKNILLSLDAYIEHNDWDALKEYYLSLKSTSKAITNDSFVLDGLENIKVSPLKSFITSKLLISQVPDLDISVMTEADDKITQLPIDLVSFIRMVGILLDNAIDELSQLGHGSLLIGLMRSDDKIVFIIQNTCRKNIPSSQLLYKAGFSTKGDDRGLGLANLSELVAKFPNVTLSTQVATTSFRQQITIAPPPLT